MTGWEDPTSDPPGDVRRALDAAEAAYRRQAIMAHVTTADGTRADVPLPAENVREVHSIRLPPAAGTIIAAGYWPSVVRAAARLAKAETRLAALGTVAPWTAEAFDRLLRMLDDERNRHAWQLYARRRGHARR